jgi:hypothetical protein
LVKGNSVTSVSLSPRVWPTVIEEACRYWLLRHRVMLLCVTAGSVLAVLLALLGQAERSQLILAAVALYSPVAAGLIAMSGIVGDERASGLILLWFQKPGRLLRSYLIRYLLYQALLAGFALGLAAIIGGIGVLAGAFPVGKSFRLAAAMVPLALLPAAIVFAFSAWGVRRDSTVAFLVILASVSASAVVSFDQGALAGVLKTIAFPIDPIMAIVGGEAYDPNLLRPLLTIAAQFTIWSAIGLLGLRHTESTLYRHI